MPKLNFLRKIFWKKVAKNFTNYLPDKRIESEAVTIKNFSKEKIYLLSDAIIDIKKFKKDKRETVDDFDKFNEKGLFLLPEDFIKKKKL